VTRVLLTGASGLLGGRLAERLAADFEVTPALHRPPPPHAAPAPGRSPVAFALEDAAGLDAAFEEARPEAVVHAAALANALACEKDPEAAHRTNVLGTAAVAAACARRGARLVLLSTDQVFDGTRSGWREGDPTEPLMVYGRTKLAAEQEALRRCAGSAVLRSALVCGRGHGPRPTASEAVAWALARGERPRLFTDEFRTPVDAEAIVWVLRALLHGTGAGVYHVGGPERVSRHELGRRVALALGLDASGIEAVTRDTFSVGPPRPADASLDSERARRELGYAPRPLEAMLRSSRPEPPPV
jgi:dTDP-4-dehydrorhamnose reductase